MNDPRYASDPSPWRGNASEVVSRSEVVLYYTRLTKLQSMARDLIANLPDSELDQWTNVGAVKAARDRLRKELE